MDVFLESLLQHETDKVLLVADDARTHVQRNDEVRWCLQPTSQLEQKPYDDYHRNRNQDVTSMYTQIHSKNRVIPDTTTNNTDAIVISSSDSIQCNWQHQQRSAVQDTTTAALHHIRERWSPLSSPRGSQSVHTRRRQTIKRIPTSGRELKEKDKLMLPLCPPPKSESPTNTDSLSSLGTRRGEGRRKSVGLPTSRKADSGKSFQERQPEVKTSARFVCSSLSPPRIPSRSKSFGCQRGSSGLIPQEQGRNDTTRNLAGDIIGAERWTAVKTNEPVTSKRPEKQYLGSAANGTLNHDHEQQKPNGIRKHDDRTGSKRGRPSSLKYSEWTHEVLTTSSIILPPLHRSSPRGP